MVATGAPVSGPSFDGIGQGFTGPQGTFTVRYAPPDNNSAVGPNHIVETVNVQLAVFNKSGTALYGPVAMNTVWSGFGGLCEADNDGDPSVLHDRQADRWIISQFAVTNPNPYLLCVAVSASGDPSGSYYRYSFPYTNMPDYPKFAVWADGYYVTTNLFQNGQYFAGASVAALDRTKMLQGLPATQQMFTTTTQYGGLLASDLDGPTPPSVGAPNYVTAIGRSSSLAFWKFHADWSTPANSTFTGPTLLPVAVFTQACNGGTCIPQARTSQQLDSLGDRLMYRLAYRNFGDHEALVVKHSVTAGSTTGPRWYEIRVNNGTPSVYQQGTYAPDSNYRWMGSIAMDRAGNMALGYSVSSTGINPQIHYTGRLAINGLGLMTQGENVLINGTGSQTTNLSRWGDYSSMAIDPSDDCTFWYTQEYLAANGIYNWHTRIGSFKFSSCGSSIVNDLSISATPTSLTAAQGTTATSTIGTTVTGTSAQSVTMSASGLPTGTTATFSPPTLNTGTSSTLTVNVGSTTVPGTYNVTVTATGASVSHSVVIALTVVNGGSTAIFNGDFETGNLNGWTASGTTSVSTTDKHAGSYAAQLGSTSATNGDSSIAQTFIAPSGSTSVGFWYLVHCPDTVSCDWATATLADTTAGTNTTILARTCTNDATWRQATTPITVGHTYTLTLVSHDDNYGSDPTYTNFDDVTLVLDSALTATATPTSTNTATATATSTNTALPTATSTNTALPTSTSTNTATATSTSTNTALPTSTSANTALPTATSTSTALPTSTSTFSATATPTATVSMNSSPTVTPSATATQVPDPTIVFTTQFAFFYGNDSLDGQPAPVGALVNAYCPHPTDSQTVCGTFRVGSGSAGSPTSQPGVYGIRVYGNDGSTGSENYAVGGDSITFTINGFLATTTSATTWQSNLQGNADLAAASTISQSRALPAGWSLLSYGVSPASNNLTDVMSSLGTTYDIVFGFDQSRGGVTSYFTDPNKAILNNLSTLQPLMGYWVHMKTSGSTFQITGQPLPSTSAITLLPGWNLVGYQGAQTTDLTTALNSLGTAYDIVFGFDQSRGGVTSYFTDPNKAILNNLSSLTPMNGYWLHIRGTTTQTWVPR